MDQNERTELQELLTSNGLIVQREQIPLPSGAHELGGWQVVKDDEIVAESPDADRAMKAAKDGLFALKPLTDKQKFIIGGLFDERYAIHEREEAAYLEQVRQGGETRRDPSYQSDEARENYSQLASAISTLTDRGYDMTNTHMLTNEKPPQFDAAAYNAKLRQENARVAALGLPSLGSVD